MIKDRAKSGQLCWQNIPNESLKTRDFCLLSRNVIVCTRPPKNLTKSAPTRTRLSRSLTGRAISQHWRLGTSDIGLAHFGGKISKREEVFKGFSCPLNLPFERVPGTETGSWRLLHFFISSGLLQLNFTGSHCSVFLLRSATFCALLLK